MPGSSPRANQYGLGVTAAIPPLQPIMRPLCTLTVIAALLTIDIWIIVYCGPCLHLTFVCILHTAIARAQPPCPLLFPSTRYFLTPHACTPLDDRPEHSPSSYSALQEFRESPHLSPHMTRCTAANGHYQTYAIPMSRPKRKRPTSLDNLGFVDICDDHAPLRPKKRRCDTDSYNPKYMAQLCFNQHNSRLRALGIPGYSRHTEEDYRQDLLVMFTHAQSKGYFRRDTAARHMIPRLTSIVLRSRAGKMALVSEFIRHYESVQCDLLFIEDLVTTNPQSNLDFVSTMRSCVATLHMTLARGTKWRTILPYAPLPRSCLPVLKGFVKDPKHCELLSDLTDSIEDIENWLSLPPPCIEFSAALKASVMDTLGQHTDTIDNTEKTMLIEDHTDTTSMTDLQGHSLEQVKALEEHVQLLEAARRETIEQARAERVEFNRRIEALEIASAKKSAKYSAREESWLATTAELESQYCKQNEQQLATIEQLTAALAAERASNIEMTRMLAEMTETLNTSITSSSNNNPTSDSSFPGAQSSSNTFASTSTDTYHGRLQPSHQATTALTPQVFPVPMEDVYKGTIDMELAASTDAGGTPLPNLPSTVQPNPFSDYVANEAILQPPLGLSGLFKEACHDYKMGRCIYGKTCRSLHTACRHWLKGKCKHGSSCYRSHDPFFLEHANLQSQSQQAWYADLMAVDNDQPQGPNASEINDPIGALLSDPAQCMYLDNTAIPISPTFPPPHNDPKASFVPTTTNHNDLSILTPDGRTLNFWTDSDIASLQGSPSITTQRSTQPIQYKKQACKKHLGSGCNRGEDCRYAHDPCPFFIKGSCKFSDEKCKNSHDPLFLTPLTSHTNTSLSAPQVSQPSTIPGQPDVESQLDAILQVGTSKYKAKKLGKTALVTSETQCRWEKSDAGCTNSRCEYRHEVKRAKDMNGWVKFNLTG